MAGEIALIVIILVFVLASVLTALSAGASFAPWIPSSVAMAGKAFAVVQPTAQMKLADLGCGDGRILFLAHRTYGVSGYGCETSLIPYLLARMRKWWHTGAPITIERKDLFTVPLEGYDIIYLYGLPRQLNQKLLPKLTKEVKSGAYVISYNFSLEGREPVASFNDKWRNVFVYRF